VGAHGADATASDDNDFAHKFSVSCFNLSRKCTIVLAKTQFFYGELRQMLPNGADLSSSSYQDGLFGHACGMTARFVYKKCEIIYLFCRMWSN
jgi:hypothetical protein